MKAYTTAAVEELQDGDVYCQEQIEAFLFCLAADASPHPLLQNRFCE